MKLRSRLFRVVSCAHGFSVISAPASNSATVRQSGSGSSLAARRASLRSGAAPCSFIGSFRVLVGCFTGRIRVRLPAWYALQNALGVLVGLNVAGVMLGHLHRRSH